jgi:4-methylaminobutanoate oxidase (formaldehyde-forming)
MRELAIAGAPVRAVRITYVGELGWELYVPVEFAARVYERLEAAGAEFGLKDAGYYALDSLRMEKAYRAWGRELTTDDTPLEAGLGFAVAWDKPGGFLGREVLLRRRDQPLAKRLVTFVLDDPEALPLGDEAIFHENNLAGSVTSAGYGHTLGRAVVMGYLRLPEGARGGIDARFVADAKFELEIAGDRFAARGSLRAPYDPQALRVKS